MIHPHLGKHDLSEKRFYRLIWIIMGITLVVVAVVVWKLEAGAV